MNGTGDRTPSGLWINPAVGVAGDMLLAALVDLGASLDAVRAELDRLLAAGDWPGLAALGATGALRPLGLEPADLASPEALGRALFRRAA